MPNKKSYRPDKNKNIIFVFVSVSNLIFVKLFLLGIFCFKIYHYLFLWKNAHLSKQG